jgi:hypothetical protein
MKSEDVKKAIHVLETMQLADGDFPSLYCRPDGSQCRVHKGSVFNTALVLTALHRQRGSADVCEMYRRGIAFIRSKIEKGSLWRFFGTMDMDLDDTSCASYLLKDVVPTTDNIPTILANRDSEGRFLTWIRKDPHNANDLDAVVNVNVLRYLGENSKTSKSCDWVMDLIEKDQIEKHIPYYTDSAVLYYFLSIFYRDHRPECIRQRLEMVSGRLVDLCRKRVADQQVMGSALCLNALRNFSIKDDELREKGRALFIKNRDQEGGWKGTPLFYAVDLPAPPMGHFQSDSFTTALIIEFFLAGSL